MFLKVLAVAFGRAERGRGVTTLLQADQALEQRLSSTECTFAADIISIPVKAHLQ